MYTGGLRPGRGHHPAGTGCKLSQAGVRPQDVACGLGRRADRLRQGQSRQAQFCIGRCRNDHPSLGRAVQGHGRHRHGACPLSRQLPCFGRPSRRQRRPEFDTVGSIMVQTRDGDVSALRSLAPDDRYLPQSFRRLPIPCPVLTSPSCVGVRAGTRRKSAIRSSATRNRCRQSEFRVRPGTFAAETTLSTGADFTILLRMNGKNGQVDGLIGACPHGARERRDKLEVWSCRLKTLRPTSAPL
jgi:hypothetical protein